MVKLRLRVLDHPVLCGRGSRFDAQAFAAEYNMDVEEIDPADLRAAEKAAELLAMGQWLVVELDVKMGL